MSGGWWGLVAAVVLGLVINEFGELSPWLARRLIRWAARVRYPTRVEELTALIAERPGKLFKLVTASGFACAALTYRVTHRKTVPVHSVTSRFWIGFGATLVAGLLLTGEILLVVGSTNETLDPGGLIILGVSAAISTAAELLVSARLPAGWPTTATSFALILTAATIFGYLSTDIYSVLAMAAAAGVSAACAIRLGNRLRLLVTAALWTILGCGLLTCSFIWTIAARNVPVLVTGLGSGFALGFSVGVGVLFWQALCRKRLSQSSAEAASHSAT